MESFINRDSQKEYTIKDIFFERGQVLLESNSPHTVINIPILHLMTQVSLVHGVWKVKKDDVVNLMP